MLGFRRGPARRQILMGLSQEKREATVSKGVSYKP